MSKIVRAMKRGAIVFTRIVAPLFYDREFLKGRHFESDTSGWRWAFRGLWFQKILGFNRSVPWPMSPFSRISNPSNLHFHVDDLNNFQSSGCYFQNSDAKIILGKGTYVAPNVGIITSNHDTNDLDRNVPGKDIKIGSSCWIGMNSVILPGVTLGDRTIVAAGAVVTKSFPQGGCVIAGVPAVIVKHLPCSNDS